MLFIQTVTINLTYYSLLLLFDTKIRILDKRHYSTKSDTGLRNSPCKTKIRNSWGIQKPIETMFNVNSPQSSSIQHDKTPLMGQSTLTVTPLVHM